MDSKKLIRMIRKIVNEEVKKVIPQVMSEMYVKDIVKQSLMKENVVVHKKKQRKKKRPSLEEALSNDILEDDSDDTGDHFEEDQAISNPHPLMNSENPLSFVYDGVQVPKDDRKMMMEQSLYDQSDRESSHENSGNFNGVDFSKFGEIFARAEQGAASRKPMSQTPEAKQREIEQRRQLLDGKKVG